jgi:fructuronate reductase
VHNKQLYQQLSESTLKALNKNVEGCGYDRSTLGIGIVHFGPGAFHRAHQAVYTDDLLRRGEKQWGICGVSIHSSQIKAALAEQDNLYTLAILDKHPRFRVIGALKKIMVAADEAENIIELLGSKNIQVVTLTVTEKGYCLTNNGHLDISNHAIIHDLDNLKNPKTVIGFLVAGLQERWKKNIPPFVVISCDNLTHNGKSLRRAVLDFSEKINAALYDWIKENVKFPSTMVDSITPATSDTTRDHVRTQIGLNDNWPIQRESFTQWVIEDIPGMMLPPWKDVGVIFSNNVHGYEIAKLRILNGMHTSLAFLGILSGIDTVRDAILEPNIRCFIHATLNNEIIPTLPQVDGLDSLDYQKIIERFENPAVCYLLSQIAGDSTQKIPYRILNTVIDNLTQQKPATRLCFVLAAWMRFVRYKTSAVTEPALVDPLADELMAIAKQCDDTADDVKRFLNLDQIFSDDLRKNPQFLQDVTNAYLAIGHQRGHAITQLLPTFY